METRQALLLAPRLSGDRAFSGFLEALHLVHMAFGGKQLA